MTNLEGIDSDHDGVRDDVQRFIVFTHPASEKTRAALMDDARVLQSILITRAGIKQLNDKNDCLEAVLMTDDSDVAGGKLVYNTYRALKSSVLNTPAKAKAFLQADALTGSSVIPSTVFADKMNRCSFNPRTLAN